MAAVFCRVGRLSSTKALQSSVAHNSRTDFCANADPEKKHLNRQLIEREEPVNAFLQRRLKEAAQQRNVPKIKPRSNAVLGLDMVISINGDVAEANPFFDKNEFYKVVKDWLCERFKEENIYGIYAHEDEKSPHIHSLIIPITEDGRLSARDVVGGPKDLVEMQDSIGLALEPLGFERGIRNTVMKHDDMKHYYGLLKEAMDEKLPNAHDLSFEEYVKEVERRWERRKAQQFALQKRIEHKMAALEGENRNYEAQTKQLQKELDNSKKEIEELNKELTDFNRLIKGIQVHCLPDEEHDRLVVLVQKCIETMEEQEQKEVKKKPNGR